MLTVAVNCAVAPTSTVAFAGLTATTTEGTVMVAEANFVVSLTDVAVSVTFKLLEGALLGAEYAAGFPLAVVVGETLPQGNVEQDTVHVTPLFAGSLVTVAVNCAVPPTCTVDVPGETETVIADGIVIVTEEVFAVSTTEIAVTVTVRLADEAFGAVYVVGVPLDVAVGETEPQVDAEQVTLQFTPLPDESLATVAVNCAVVPGCTVAVVWDSEMLTAGGVVGGSGGTLANPPPHPALPAARAAVSSSPRTDWRSFALMTNLFSSSRCGPLRG